jgi:hypothetical protein
MHFDLFFRKSENLFKLKIYQMAEDLTEATHLLDTKIITHDTQGIFYSFFLFLFEEMPFGLG